MAPLNALADCLTCNANENGKSTIIITKSRARTTREIAADVVNTLLNTDKKGRHLERTLHTVITENIGKSVLSGLETAIREGTVMSQTMREAYNKVTREAYEFAHDHPAFCTLIALGMLALLTPVVLEAIGFGLEGPIAGTFAAWWQSKYAGYVPMGSLFSFFQRLGMTMWRWKF